MREGYSTHCVCLYCVCMCVSLTTLEATLIYSAKNTHKCTANGILFILKNSNPANRLLRFRNSCLNPLHCNCTSYGHAHLLKFKVHFPPPPPPPPQMKPWWNITVACLNYTLRSYGR